MAIKWNAYLRLIRFDKPIGNYLILWPVLSALWLASNGQPHAKTLLIFILGVWVMRAFGCIINDLIDRKWDLNVERTKNRPITTGEISSKEALFLAFILGVLGFILVLFLNLYSLVIACIALVFTLFYPMLKRWTHLPQVGLGLVFNFGILMAFAAEKNALTLNAWILFMAALLLTVAFDTIYAMMDREDDVRIGIKSTAILTQGFELVFVSALQGAALILLILLRFFAHLNFYYDFGLLLMMLTFAWQYQLVNTGKKENYLLAFQNYHFSWLFLFLGIFLAMLK